MIVLQPATPNGAHDDEHIEVEDWTQSYVHITQDIIPNDETRSKLRRQAPHWRGITAITGSPSPVPPTSSSLPIPSTSAAHITPSSHTTRTRACCPLPTGCTPPFPSPPRGSSRPSPQRSPPSSSYLADPLNAYAHLGMLKPYVHLVGPPLDVVLDARLAGNEGRFVWNGCRPNAVLRPVPCADAGAGAGGKENANVKEKVAKKSSPSSTIKAKPNPSPSPNPNGKGKERAINLGKDDTGSTLSFGVFALRDLRAGEEVVLGWEWDDGNAVHSLRALLKTPGIIPPASSFCSKLELELEFVAGLPLNFNANVNNIPLKLTLKLKLERKFKCDIRPAPTQRTANPAPAAPNDEHPARPLFNFHHLRLSPRER
ncbi:hypothetical protein BDZ97DRAFT_1923380 [Flammula alnicola]|nr:hypothetical protein BDZ97DRAFT_1923380 [Flammula alnicola]